MSAPLRAGLGGARSSARPSSSLLPLAARATSGSSSSPSSAIYFIAILGLNILTGYNGQISLGHGGFMAIGAYTTAILSVDHGVGTTCRRSRSRVSSPGSSASSSASPRCGFRGVYLALATFAIPVALIPRRQEVRGLHRRRRRA